MQAQGQERFTSSESLLIAQDRWNNCSNWQKKRDCCVPFTQQSEEERKNKCKHEEKKNIDSVLLLRSNPFPW